VPIGGFLFVQILFFAGLLYIMYRLLGRQAQDVTGHLSELNAEYEKKKEALRVEHAEEQARAKVILEKAQKEAAELKRRLVGELEVKQSQVLDESHEEGARIVQDAVKCRDALRSELMRTMEARVVERACELLGEVLSDDLRKELHQNWFRRVMDNGLLRLKELKSTETVQDAFLVSAFPLTKQQRNELQDQLDKTLGHSIGIKESVDTKIVAGVTIRIGHLVLNGSFASKLRKAAQSDQDKAA
jgi:F0F1-type ATP synthase delta subunit